MKIDIKVVAGTVTLEGGEGGLKYQLPKGFEYVVLMEDGGAYGISASDKERTLNIDEEGNVMVEDAGVIISA